MESFNAMIFFFASAFFSAVGDAAWCRRRYPVPPAAGMEIFRNEAAA